MIPSQSFPATRFRGDWLRSVLMVAAGGAAGAAVRWGVVEFVGSHRFDWATLIVNVVGSLILGWVGSALLAGHRPQHNLLIAVGSGFCGALTTFSGLTVGVAQELRNGAWDRGLLTIAITLALCLPAVLVGRAAFLRRPASTSRLL